MGKKSRKCRVKKSGKNLGKSRNIVGKKDAEKVGKKVEKKSIKKS